MATKPKREVVIARRGPWKGRAMPIVRRMTFSEGAIGKTRDGSLSAGSGDTGYVEVHIPVSMDERVRSFLE